jgi:hypothetical protein
MESMRTASKSRDSTASTTARRVDGYGLIAFTLDQEAQRWDTLVICDQKAGVRDRMISSNQRVPH